MTVDYSKMNETQAFAAGKRAAFSLQSEHDNPFAYGTELHFSWEDGFRLASEEIGRTTVRWDGNGEPPEIGLVLVRAETLQLLAGRRSHERHLPNVAMQARVDVVSDGCVTLTADAETFPITALEVLRAAEVEVPVVINALPVGGSDA